MWLRILRRGNSLDYLGGPNVTTRLLVRGRQEGQNQRRCDGGEWCKATSQGRKLLEPEEGKETDCPLELPLNGANSADPFQLSEFQNYKIIKLCCFKTLHLFYYSSRSRRIIQYTSPIIADGKFFCHLFLSVCHQADLELRLYMTETSAVMSAWGRQLRSEYCSMERDQEISKWGKGISRRISKCFVNRKPCVANVISSPITCPLTAHNSGMQHQNRSF